MRTIRNCPVAVIGGAGFLGSHLVEHLIEGRNCEVLVVDNLEVGRRDWLHSEAGFIHCDITGSEAWLRLVFEANKIRFVFNYAARPYVPDSYKRPVRTMDVNAMGALKVINAAQEAGVQAILQVSSAEVYGGDLLGSSNLRVLRELSINEEFPVAPHSSYGVSKAMIDAECQVAWKERQTPVIALRQFNCVGERETHPYVVPEIISQLARMQQERIVDGYSRWDLPACAESATIKLGNNSFRDFMYAGDAVWIAVELLERGQFGEVYNLGSEGGIKVYDLAKLIGKLMGFADVKVEQDQARVRPWEIWHLQSDNSKLYAAVHANKRSPSLPQPLTQLEEALRRKIKWYESNVRKWPWERQ